jgi:hypothetical protein
MILIPRPIAQRSFRLFANVRGYTRSLYVSRCELESRTVFLPDRSASGSRLVRKRLPHFAYRHPDARKCRPVMEHPMATTLDLNKLFPSPDLEEFECCEAKFQEEEALFKCA